MSQVASNWSDLYRKEDWWAIWLAMGLVLAALALFFSGASLKPLAVAPGKWGTFSEVGSHFAGKWPWYVCQLGVWLLIFSVSARFLGLKVREFVPGFLILYGLATAIFIASSWKFASNYNLEAPLIALAVGLLGGNLLPLPGWLDAALRRTEYYIKTGIILLGATLPFTLIYKAGAIAFLQASIVSLSTFFAIYLVATRVFKLDRRFSAVMGAGGSVCGVSASIAVGGAVEADQEHVAISISLVTIWAIVMIFVLPIVCKRLGMDPGRAGAWIGTSEFADAAGLAAAQAMGSEKAIRAFTLMKVIGRDIWIGLWSFVLAIVSVVYWKKQERKDANVSVLEIWRRFPKFVLGFFAASLLVSLVSLFYPGDAYDKLLKPDLLEPIKTLRTWTFIFAFLCIGFTTRFRQLAKFGWQPLAAFTAGVALNVPLGYVLSNLVFASYWSGITAK